MDNGSDSAASSTIYDINSDNNDIGIKIRAKKEEEEEEEDYNNHDNENYKNGTDDYDLNRRRVVKKEEETYAKEIREAVIRGDRNIPKLELVTQQTRIGSMS